MQETCGSIPEVVDPQKKMEPTPAFAQNPADRGLVATSRGRKSQSSF